MYSPYSKPKKTLFQKLRNLVCWASAAFMLVIFVIIVTMEDYQRERFTNLLVKTLTQ